MTEDQARIERIIKSKDKIKDKPENVQDELVKALSNSISDKIQLFELNLNNALRGLIQPKKETERFFFIRRSELLKVVLEDKSYPGWFLDEEIDRLLENGKEETNS